MIGVLKWYYISSCNIDIDQVNKRLRNVNLVNCVTSLILCFVRVTIVLLRLLQRLAQSIVCFSVCCVYNYVFIQCNVFSSALVPTCFVCLCVCFVLFVLFLFFARYNYKFQLAVVTLFTTTDETTETFFYLNRMSFIIFGDVITFNPSVFCVMVGIKFLKKSCRAKL